MRMEGTPGHSRRVHTAASSQRALSVSRAEAAPENLEAGAPAGIPFTVTFDSDRSQKDMQAVTYLWGESTGVFPKGRGQWRWLFHLLVGSAP